ncbi:glycosyltransferase family 4 protein [Streptomyces sp. R302]|nr:MULTISPECIES: glycosyltransferase family 4 protein [unclassified Streptomyces]NML55398.1 glycosyltransferase family 4 protein [Streptomyces sp. R301]NML80270.1 glycosyltransferase family 4 protein [Streptomyces sp. R302]
MLHEMLRALVVRGHRAEVWLSQWPGSSEPYEVDGVHVVPPQPGRAYEMTARRAGVLISHLENVPDAASLARGYGIPHIVICHNTFDLTWQPLVTGSTTAAVVNSEWMRAVAEEKFTGAAAFRPGQLLVVRPPVHPEAYATRPGDAITLINCTSTKGVGVLAELALRMPNRRFLAVLGGYGEQQPPADLPNVEVVEHLDGHRMRDEVYGRTRVLLMPSDYESWGRAGVEAMASGIPVIAHPTPGLRESLGQAGIFCDRDDIDAWAKAIEGLDEPGVYRAAGRRSKARSKALDPAGDLDGWCRMVEEVGRARASVR